MKVSISKSKNSTILYISKSVRINGKSTTKTVERLGTLEEVRLRAGDQDPLEWAKEYARELTRKEKEGQRNVMVKYSSDKQIPKDKQQLFNGGYLFLQDIYYALGMDKICRDISDRYKFEFNLNEILSYLVYSRIIYPASKLATHKLACKYIEQPSFNLQHIYRALEILARENDFIQAELYKNSHKIYARNKGVLFYDCTNYYFEIEIDDDFRKYGYSKENKPNPIVQMGLFMDGNGVPLAFDLTPGNTNEQITLKPLEKKILKDFGVENIVVCTDAGLSSYENRKFNSRMGRGFITTQSIKSLKGYLQDFCLDPTGWKLSENGEEYDISKFTKDDEKKYRNETFYKSRWINEHGLEQQLIVTYSIKYRDYSRAIRSSQVDRAEKAIENNSVDRHSSTDYKRLIDTKHCTGDGEIAEKKVSAVDDEKVRKEESYDGFYAICTNLESDKDKLIKVSRKRWEIEECFRIMKHEFKARPVYLSNEDRIRAHFLTCFIALMVYRILENRLSGEYTCEEIISELRSLNFLRIEGEGYVPTYTRTDITDKLHETSGFRTDYQIVTNREMKKIFKSTKKR